MNDKYAFVTDMSMSSQYDELITLDVSIRTNDAKIYNLFMPGHEQFSGIMTTDSEFKCLWCSSPNPLSHQHCSQCGAPRGVIIR